MRLCSKDFELGILILNHSAIYEQQMTGFTHSMDDLPDSSESSHRSGPSDLPKLNASICNVRSPRSGQYIACLRESRSTF
jgi:hypothetical protein